MGRRGALIFEVYSIEMAMNCNGFNVLQIVTMEFLSSRISLTNQKAEHFFGSGRLGWWLDYDKKDVACRGETLRPFF